jgi:hypothetical protein
MSVEQLPAEDLVSFHILYTDDDTGVKETFIDADCYGSAERIFNEKFPHAGYYEIGAPIGALRWVL